MTQQRATRKRTPASPAMAYDLEVVSRLDGVTAPKQQRSEIRLRRVLGALEALLQEKPFAQIYIPEIAVKADCSAATIYGRFKDKDSILAALHESLRERMIMRANIVLDPAQWVGQPFEALTSRYCLAVVKFYRENRHLLAAALVIGDPMIYERAALTVQHIAERFALCAASLMPATVDAGFEARADLAIRSVFALLHQRLLFEPVRLSRLNEGDDATFAAELSRVIVKLCG